VAFLTHRLEENPAKASRAPGGARTHPSQSPSWASNQASTQASCRFTLGRSRWRSSRTWWITAPRRRSDYTAKQTFYRLDEEPRDRLAL